MVDSNENDKLIYNKLHTIYVIVISNNIIIFKFILTYKIQIHTRTLWDDWLRHTLSRQYVTSDET